MNSWDGSFYDKFPVMMPIMKLPKQMMPLTSNGKNNAKRKTTHTQLFQFIPLLEYTEAESIQLPDSRFSYGEAL